VQFVVILHKKGESIWGFGLGVSNGTVRDFGLHALAVDHELEPAEAVTTHLPFRVETLTVPAYAVPALLTPVCVLGPDLIAVAPVYHWQLWEPGHCFLCPGPPQWTMPVPVARYDPASCVAHLVYQGVPQPVPRVKDLCGQFNPARPDLYVVPVPVPPRVAESSSLGQPHVPGDLHLLRQSTSEALRVVQSIQPAGQLHLLLREVLQIR